MKKLLKIIIVLLIAAALVSVGFLAGRHSAAGPSTDTPVSTPVNTPVGTPINTPTDAPAASVPPEPVLTLPILDEIDDTVMIGTAGSSLLAVQAAAKLLDWGLNTGLDTEEISRAASAWLAAKDETAAADFLQKLELVDDTYQRLLGDDARELLDAAGCEDVEIAWGSEPLAPVEAVMQAAGLRG